MGYTDENPDFFQMSTIWLMQMVQNQYLSKEQGMKN